VKTDQGWILEFQHSYLKSEERQARGDFYPKLAWVVDGMRRINDKPQFFRALKEGVCISSKPMIKSVFTDECTLLREWGGSRSPVLFDFGESDKPEEAALWCLVPSNSDARAYVAALTREGFIKLHRTEAVQVFQDFAQVLKRLSKIISVDISRRHSQTTNRLLRQSQSSRSHRAKSFEEYLARKQRARSRRRF